jgi:hypothetical protein
MCMECDGYSEEQIARWLELTILTHGWAVQGVEPSSTDDPNGGWAYTVGATASYGIPELVITDTDFSEAGHVLNWAVEKLRDGGTIDDLVADYILWVPVHDNHLDSGLFASYWDHYRTPPEPGWVIQLFPSNREHCAECVKASSTDLSDPNQLPAMMQG